MNKSSYTHYAFYAKLYFLTKEQRQNIEVLKKATLKDKKNSNCFQLLKSVLD